MKRCPEGHIEHNDSLNFCTQCGKMLEKCDSVEDAHENHTTTIDSSNDVPKTPKKKSKTGRILKRIAIAVVIVLCAIGIWVNSRINSTTYLTFNHESVIFPKGGSTVDVSIDYDGILWDITYCPKWIETTEDDMENTITLKCEPNTTGENREDHITVTSGKIVRQLPVGQYARATYIRPDTYKVDFGRSGGSATIDLESDGTDITATYPDYVTLTWNGNRSVRVSTAYNSGTTHDGSIVFTEDNQRVSVAIHQKGDCPSCNGKGSRSCNMCGGSGYTGFGMYSYPCNACGTNGSIRCSACQGTGER